MTLISCGKTQMLRIMRTDMTFISWVCNWFISEHF